MSSLAGGGGAGREATTVIQAIAATVAMASAKTRQPQSYVSSTAAFGVL
jgi:hypothetical protein